MNEYEQQAQEFLESANATLTVDYLYTAPYFPDDKDSRDIYQFTIKTPRGSYSAKFGASLRDTALRKIIKNEYTSKNILSTLKMAGIYDRKIDEFRYLRYMEKARKLYKQPTAYDILACLDGYSPGTFNDFCDNYGYDNDSLKALKVYQSVCEQWEGLRRIFTSEQLEKLNDIS